MANAPRTLLYEQTLAEGHRGRSGGRSVLISEDAVSLDKALRAERQRWDIVDERLIVQRSMRPRSITMRRREHGTRGSRSPLRDSVFIFLQRFNARHST